VRGGRSYKWPPPGVLKPGQAPEFEVASVTTLLGNGLPKPALMYWAAKMVAEKACENPDFIKQMIDAQGKDETIKWLKGAHRTFTNKKADMGTIAHMAIEHYVDGRPMTAAQIDAELVERKVPLDMWKVTKGYIDGAKEFFDACEPEILESEVTVYSRAHGYAGTLDLLGRLSFGGERLPCIMDFKTGKGVYPEMGLQLCAYARADFIGTTDGVERPLADVFGGEPIQHGVIVRLKPGGFEVKSFTLSDDLFQVFLAVKGVALGLPIMEQAMRPGL
jgi:hypothetical protein